MAPVIRKLSNSMINKIAAGEVVERPMNVVKELVENSIDAGATRVEIDVDKSGSELVRISDNGCGIARDELVLALSPHSTSKISEPDDLFSIHTLGFRGEALASIAEVSQLILSSRASDSEEGAAIRSDGGEQGEIEPVGRAVGTTIEVRNLFFNVPARRKFLKSQATEFGHIQAVVERIAIPNDPVAFVLRHNGRVVYDLPGGEGMKERIRRLYTGEVADRLIPIESVYRDVKVVGYVGSPDLTRSSTNMQFLFLNGRFIRDRSLQHALAEAYRSLIISNRFPVAFLNIVIPPDFVDVNVHPTKMEVRFVNAQAIYSSLLGSIRDKFLRSELTSRPNEAELEVAAARTQERLAKQSAQEEPREEKEEETSAEPDAQEKKTQEDGVDPSDDVDPNETTETAAPNRRFVPDVDPSDPRAALDDDAVEAKRRNFLEWFDSKKASKKADASEKTEAPDDEPFDQKRLDVEDANAALAEAAARERSESGLDAYARRPPRDPFAGPGEFRKFPPLGGAAPREVQDEPSRFAKGSFGGRVPTANAAREPEREPERGSDRVAPTKETAAQDASTTPSLFDRVAMNNRGALRPNAPLSQQVARTSSGKPVVQMCSRYLVMEKEDGIAIVDQHALHERILFERLKANLEKGSLDVQRLLVPEVVDLTSTEAPFVQENREVFEKLGILVEPFGGTSFVVNGYPSILRDLPPGEIFREALAVLLTNRGKLERADMLDFALKQMSCKAAIKAGDALRPDAVVELIAAAEEELSAHHCPHGRPSTLVFSCQEIDKLFKRL